VKHKVECVRSFGRYARGTSIVYFPTRPEEILQVFEDARRSPRRRVAIRGGGHSFDSQAVHDGDRSQNIILSGRCLEPRTIEFDAQGRSDLVRLGAGVTWGNFVAAAIERAHQRGEPIRLPASIQTGRNTTIGGSLAGNTLSRFSGIGGKESEWIESFRLITPRGDQLDVSRDNLPDLFHAVVGGHGYLGVVTDATYRVVPIDAASVAHTTITRHRSFKRLIEKQLSLVRKARKRSPAPTAVSSAWFQNPKSRPPFKGAVFESRYAPPGRPKRRGFPLYNDIEAEGRYWAELLARIPEFNLAIHEVLYYIAGQDRGRFENGLRDFLFFMDGNTVAKEKFERRHKPKQFPILQQTYVIAPDGTECFAEACEREMQQYGVQPTECDMLYVKQDHSLMSANYQLDGFAVTLGFEPIAFDGDPPPQILKLLMALSERCLEAHGRIHLVKNVYVDKKVFYKMFSPQIGMFEKIKRQYDPDLLIQNSFSDRLFNFSADGCQQPC
jgi:decaprenylphospho-beta-D-ribofuranose 2-oxidase